MEHEWQQRLWDRALAEFRAAGEALAAALAAHVRDPESPEAQAQLQPEPSSSDMTPSGLRYLEDRLWEDWRAAYALAILGHWPLNSFLDVKMTAHASEHSQK